MSSITVPYLHAPFGFKIAPPQGADFIDSGSGQVLHASPLAGQSITRLVGGQELLPEELREISHRIRSVAPALAALDRLKVAIEDQRLSLKASGGLAVVGLWNRAISLLRFVGSPWLSLSAHRGAAGSDQVLSARATELKRITENVVIPSISQVREDYRGRSFVRNSDTSQALLLISLPSDKVGKIFSFDSLRLMIDTRVLNSSSKCDLSRGEGRVVLTRSMNGVREQLELAYKRPGKVDVYVDGERRGSSWNDDAFEVCEAFIAGRPIPLERRKRSEHYTIW